MYIKYINKMKTFTFNSVFEFKQTINKSKFIAYGYSVSDSDEVKDKLKKLQKQYPDATHICHAYILGNNQEEFHYSDDGEPSKTAGFPIYQIMKQNNLSYSLVCVIRYFGGIKLGTSNLKNAFISSVKGLIDNSQLVGIENRILCKVELSFKDIKYFERIFDNRIVKKEFNEDKIYFYIALLPTECELLSKYKYNVINNFYLYKML